MMCGGLGPPKPADQSIQALCDKVKPEAEKKAGNPFSEFNAISYSSQVVAGTNHFIKVHVGGGDHVHLRVFVSLPHVGAEPEVHSVKLSMKADDPIEHF